MGSREQPEALDDQLGGQIKKAMSRVAVVDVPKRAEQSGAKLVAYTAKRAGETAGMGDGAARRLVRARFGGDCREEPVLVSPTVIVRERLGPFVGGITPHA